jgi:hypothetical protein
LLFTIIFLYFDKKIIKKDLLKYFMSETEKPLLMLFDQNNDSNFKKISNDILKITEKIIRFLKNFKSIGNYHSYFFTIFKSSLRRF